MPIVYPHPPIVPKDPVLFGQYSELYKLYLKSVERCARVASRVPAPTPTVQVASVAVSPATIGGSSKQEKKVTNQKNGKVNRAERRKLVSLFPSLCGPLVWKQVQRLSAGECRAYLAELEALKKAGSTSTDPKVAQILSKIERKTRGRPEKVITSAPAKDPKGKAKAKTASPPPLRVRGEGRDFQITEAGKKVVGIRAAREVGRRGVPTAVPTVVQQHSLGDAVTIAERAPKSDVERLALREKRRQALMVYLEANPGKTEDDFIAERRQRLKDTVQIAEKVDAGTILPSALNKPWVSGALPVVGPGTYLKPTDGAGTF